MTREPDPITKGLWLGTLALMGLIPFISIPMDFVYGAAKGIGWTGNLALITAFFFALSMRGMSKVLIGGRDKALLAFGLSFIVYAAAGLAFGPNNFILSLAAILGIAGGLGAGYGAYALAKSGTDPIKPLLRWTLIGSLPFLVLPFLVEATLPRFEGKEWMFNLYGFSNPRSLGHYSTIAIVILVGLTAAVLPKNAAARAWRLPHFALLTAMWAILMWSGSRGGVAALGVGLLLSCLVLWRLKIAEVLWNVAAAVIGSAISLAFVIPHNSYGVLNRFVSFAEKAREVTSAGGGGASAVAEEVATGRVEVWTWAIARIAEKPWFGWSYLPMRGIEADDHPGLAHAHNIVLDYAMGFGIPLAALVIGIVVWLWWRAGAAARRANTAAAQTAFHLATVLPVYSMLSAVLISPYQLSVFGVVIGGLIGAEVLRKAGGVPAAARAKESGDEPDGVADDAIFV